MKKIICLICLICLIITGCSKEKEKKEIKKEVKEKKYSLSMITAGDTVIHSSVYKDAYNNSTKTYDFKKQLELIKPIVQKYDLAYYNQETTLGGKEIELSDYPRFNSPHEFGDAMLDAGFNIVSLATNHTIDRGETAVLNSLNYWSNKDVLTAGSYKSIDDRNKNIIKEKNNITYAMLSYTYGTNGIPVPQGKDYLVNVWPTNSKEEYEAYKTQVKSDIERLRDKVDVLIVSMHWGVEYTHTPTSYELDSAKFLSDLGVNLIIGTHPHVVQPVTFINDTLVIYSLGNFLSSQAQDDNYNKMVGLMTSFNINKTVKGKKTTIKIDNVNNELTYNYYKNWRNFKIVPFSQMDSNYLSNYQEIYQKYKEVIQAYDNNMNVLPTK